MRSLKFRVYDTQEKYWLDPEHFYITGEGRLFTCQQSRSAISCRYELMGTDRYILIQNTGLKDKNDKEIYEGDIISHFYDYGRPKSEIIEIKWDKTICGYGLHYNVAANSEIIGNKTDNPELLEPESEAVK